MRVLVTGGTGQLGRALIACAPAWADVTAPLREELDLERLETIAPALADARVDWVINAAAYTGVDRAESQAARAKLVNTDAVTALAQHAPALVQVSTDFVFDGEQGRPYRPEDATHPLSVYGSTKLGGETAALTNPRALVVRTGWLYAAGGGFVATMLKIMRERDEVRVVADQIGTPTHARGLATAIWMLIAAKERPGRIVHWSDAGVASWYDFALAIQEEALRLGMLSRAVPIVPIATRDYPTPARRPGFSVLDKGATWALTGPARHWRVELRECLKVWPA